MKTNKDVMGRIERQGMFGQLGLLSPEYIAGKSLIQLFKRDTLILLGRINKLNWLLMAVVPVWIMFPLMFCVV